MTKTEAKRKAKKARKPWSLERIIREATARELTKMQEADGYIDKGWSGAALASYVSPGIVRAVRDHLTKSES